MNYNVNPAVIKSQMLQMNKTDFIACAIEIKSIITAFDFNEKTANKRFMFLNLYVWARTIYKKKFMFV
jgi:hypothetical protein